MAAGQTFRIPNVMEGGLSDFDGPLDLLLFLIKKNEVSLYDIPIASITDQYIDYIANAEAVELDDMADFHLLASTLLYIKSKMLLPVEFGLEDDAEDPRSELVERLLEYQKYKKLSEMLEDAGREAEWVFERRSLERALPFEQEAVLKKMNLWELLRVFKSLMGSFSTERIIDLFEEVTVNEKITLLEEILEKDGECHFDSLVVRPSVVMDIVCAFLAVLEYIKMRKIEVLQNEFLGEIILRQAENAA